MEHTTDNRYFNYDAIVIGAGHAGIEAGLALARLNKRTLILSITLDNIGYLACNPSIGGTAKGHLVRELDALGGEMGVAADKCLTQLRMLNRSKGAAVHSLRAQVDKYRYHGYMKSLLENTPNLTLRQGEVKRVLTDGNTVTGVETVYNQTFYAPAVILACGVYLNSAIIVGDVIEEKGPAGFMRANHLSAALGDLNIPLRRFKTGTPARVHLDSIDLSKLEVQAGETDIYSFSHLSKKVNATHSACYLGYTNDNTHRIIRDNLSLAPKYAGLIHGAGARYCPSVEDKIVRFADKERHQFFLEPEGDGTKEMYVQGLSTSLPAFVQHDLYRSIEGFENIRIMRDAYAIEYDCIDPTTLMPSLMHMTYSGLFFAGQINGTSGYEEAAAQGLIAGINAARYLSDEPPFILTRDEAYIGVLIDDLVTKGTDEPYRMMTSRAEFRLVLRQDNADLRLTEYGRKIGLVSDARYKTYQKRLKTIEKARKAIKNTADKQLAAAFLTAVGEPLPNGGITIGDIIKRGAVTFRHILENPELFSGIDGSVAEFIYHETRYEGYLARAEALRKEQKRLENTLLPDGIDYLSLKGLRIEAAEKLNRIRPRSIGQASRISGVNPADISILILSLRSAPTP